MSESIGEIVKKERRALGLSQRELGDLATTGLNFVSQLERGKPTVRLDKVNALLKVLGLQLSVTRINSGKILSAK